MICYVLSVFIGCFLTFIGFLSLIVLEATGATEVPVWAIVINISGILMVAFTIIKTQLSLLKCYNK